MNDKKSKKAILIITEKFDVSLKVSTILSNRTAKKDKTNGTVVFEFEKDGDRYYVIGLRGHIVKIDFDEKYRKWDIETILHLVNANIVKKIHEQSIFKTLLDLSKNADEVIIATDYDREGELIGTEALPFILANRNIPLKRAKFSSLTGEEINNAFSNLIEVNWNLAHAAEARQIIDLIWGATLTRFLTLNTKNSKNIMSIGRVQGPTLALLVNRFNEIELFKPEPRWKIILRAKTNDGFFEANHTKNPFLSENDAKMILERTKDVKYAKVMGATYSEYKEYPPAPFNTTTFLVDATKLGFAADRAMDIAEKLYTSGYISYPRTDNTVYPNINMRSHLDRISTSYFENELEMVKAQKHITPTRGKIVSTDHPPIYPVEKCSKKKLSPEQWAIYELVMRRFLATLYKPAVVSKAEITLAAGTEAFIFKGFNTIDEGWYQIYTYAKSKHAFLPKVSVGDDIEIVSVDLNKEMTKPPPMYTQATLLTEMERLGLGTKSTRPEIIKKLYERKYVEGRSLTPTGTGIVVTNALSRHAPIITKPDMTAKLEEEMNEIAENGKKMEKTINDSRILLKQVLDTLYHNIKDISQDISNAINEQNHLGRCPLCGSEVVVRYFNGRRFIGCSHYPSCKYTLSIPQKGLLKPAGEKCKLCSNDMLLILTKTKKELLCLNSSCENSKFRKVVGKCPSCGDDLIIRESSRGGRFVGCSSYPKCKVTYPLPQYGDVISTGQSCTVCGSPIIEVINKKGDKWQGCINPKCPSKKKKEESPAQ